MSSRKSKTTFSEQAKDRQTGPIAEFYHFLTHNKKWWLVPIIVTLLCLSVLVIIGGSGAAPFIYSLF